MTAARRQNLKRFFAPRHIAFIGGASAEAAAGQCVAAGFDGGIWGVNPKRQEMAGRPCFPSVAALPEGPDAVFLAVPAAVAIETVAALREKGAGGIGCFTAGFGELGAEGRERERALVEACGDMVLVGPNCSGVLNNVKRAPLWPFDHGAGPVTRGPAFVTQSGMLGNTVTLNQRSLDFSYIISAGNQAMLGVEDFLEFLVDEPAVTAIGLYIEGLRDVGRFSQMAVRCLKAGKPIVAQKAGHSEIGAQLTVTHTGSLAGSGRLYHALFERLGVIAVATPVEMIEALKLATVAGIPAGNRVAVFTCSGGDSTMAADAGEGEGLSFPRPSPDVSRRLAQLLPPIATLSNPLDYTTPLWGDEGRLEPVFKSFLQDGYDAALLVQDYPTPIGGESYAPYLADARAFRAATSAAGIPAVACNILPETFDARVRQELCDGGVAPLQGLSDGIKALAGVARFGTLRQKLKDQGCFDRLHLAGPTNLPETSRSLDEWQAKALLRKAGLPLLPGQLVSEDDAVAAAEEIGYPVVVKLVHADLPHKTEAGAVKVNLSSARAVTVAIQEIKESLARYRPDLKAQDFLVEKMAPKAVAELLLGYRHDPLFGPSLVLGAGGILTELLDEVAVLLFPFDRDDLAEALDGLKVGRLLDGYRGGRAVDRAPLIDAVMAFAAFAEARRDQVMEMDINPLLVCENGPWVVDALLRVADEAL